MPALTFADAWQAYRRAETLLPAKPPPVTPRRVGDVAAIADDFDVVALDAWGVLNLGETAIATAPEAVAGLRATGKRLAVLSNSGSRDAEISAARLNRLGFDFAAAEIITGLDLVPAALAALALPAPVGFVAGSAAALPALTRGMLALGDDGADYDRVSGIVFLSTGAWSEARHALLQASLERRKRPLIVANPDIASPEPDGMEAEPGWYAQRIAAATGARVISCGKPFPAIYQRMRARHPDVAPERVLCVGDTLHTDILGGRAAGCRTLLIEDGFMRGADAPALARESGIWPDFVAPRL
ncbi:MAG TPA: HAD hydrolase-like protein [Stellaceae bacterium]|nr:HAD hydrolase-like protein [Stellaceae bacterium]